MCHNAKKRHDADLSGGLALDSWEGVLAGTPSRKVLVPGHSAESEIVRRLADTDEDRRMPLQDRPLPELEQKLIRRWIDAGVPRGLPAVSTAVPIRNVTVAGLSRPARRRPALEVVLPTELKLPPRTLNLSQGGTLEVALPVGPLPAVTSLAFRGDNRLLAVGTYGQVVLWDLGLGHPAGAIRDIPGPVQALAFSRDGRRVALGAGLPARSGVVRICSVPDGTLIHDFSGHDDVVSAVSLRPDGAQLASGSFDHTVRLWDLGLGRPAGVFRGHSDFVHAVAYTPDGRALLTASKDRTIKRLNARTLKEERTYSGHDQEVLAIAIDPSGSRFVSAGDEPQIRWWTLSGDAPVARRAGHTGPVHRLAFSGDGRRLISAGGDRSVRLWDARGKAEIRRLGGPTEWQYAAAISDDARLAAAGGWDGLVRLWDAESGRLRVTLVQPPLDGDAKGKAYSEPAGIPTAWFACCPSGPVDGSTELVHAAHWRAGGVSLDPSAARAVAVRPDLVARAMRGEPAAAITFPKK
jgi:hypothetical protein